MVADGVVRHGRADRLRKEGVRCSSIALSLPFTLPFFPDYALKTRASQSSAHSGRKGCEHNEKSDERASPLCPPSSSTRRAWASGLLARKRYGSLLARHSGRTTASSLLRGLIAWNDDESSVWARASGMARTIDSAYHFLDGLAGRPFDLVLGSDDELLQAGMTKGPRNEKVEVLPFGREWNCSLSVGSCSAERLLDPVRSPLLFHFLTFFLFPNGFTITFQLDL